MWCAGFVCGMEVVFRSIMKVLKRQGQSVPSGFLWQQMPMRDNMRGTADKSGKKGVGQNADCPAPFLV